MEGLLDEDEFAHVIAFEAMTKKLEDVTDHDQKGRAIPQVPPPLGKLPGCQAQGDHQKWDSNGVQEPRGGVLVTLEPMA